MWSEDFASWTKGRKNKKGLSKGNDGSQKGSFRPYHPDEGAGKDYSQNKGKGKSQKGKSKEEAHPQSGRSASEAPEEERYSHACESDDWSSSQWPDDSWTPAAGWKSARDTAWMAVPSLNLAYHPTHVALDLGCTRSRSAVKRCQKHAAVRTLLCLQTRKQKPVWKVALFVDVLETGDVPILFSLPQMRYFGFDY